MKCKICGSQVNYIFSNEILHKYNVKYFQCPDCGFVFTESPYWLEEAYSDAIADSDTGMMKRNVENAVKINSVFNLIFGKKDHRFLDYGGGYGIFTRLMRDYGFDFRWFDKFCDNLAAKGFEYDADRDKKITAITAFELFEHFENPIEEMEKMLNISHNIVFSTLCYDKKKKYKEKDWWYYTPETGQHISFYSEETLEYMAQKYNLYYCHMIGLHFFTKNKICFFKRLLISAMYKLGVAKVIWFCKMQNYDNCVNDQNYLL